MRRADERGNDPRVSDTIFALSSGTLPAAIAVVRISGPEAFAAAERLAGDLPPPRTLSLRSLRDEGGELVDKALVAIFPAPATATGEPLVELHCHGSRAVVARVLEVLAAVPGLRHAEPGEFTRRALQNGRLDLTEAEGLGDLLAAETEWQRRAALRAADGGLRRQVEQWREELVMLAARAEAAIDYVDEEETELDLSALHEAAERLRSEWIAALEAPRAEPLQQGLRIVLGGPTNAGKSSLLNALVGCNRAIVTDIPGTTRDLIEVALDLRGIKVILVDTAGLRESEDRVEQIGVSRSMDALRDADLILWLGAPEDAPAHPEIILVHARADERTGETVPREAVATSVRTGVGLDDLTDAMRRRCEALLPAPEQTSLNRRQAEALQEASDALSSLKAGDPLLTAEALRQAMYALDRLSGRQSTEDLLDALFGRFCLGK